MINKFDVSALCMYDGQQKGRMLYVLDLEYSRQTADVGYHASHPHLSSAVTEKSHDVTEIVTILSFMSATVMVSTCVDEVRLSMSSKTCNADRTLLTAAAQVSWKKRTTAKITGLLYCLR